MLTGIHGKHPFKKVIYKNFMYIIFLQITFFTLIMILPEDFRKSTIIPVSFCITWVISLIYFTQKIKKSKCPKCHLKYFDQRQKIKNSFNQSCTYCNAEINQPISNEKGLKKLKGNISITCKTM